MDTGKIEFAPDYISRRQMIKHTGMTIGAVALVGGGAVSQMGCGKNVGVYVSTVIGVLKDISPLLPNSSALITKAVSVAEAFDKAYRKGAFDSATALFEDLAGLISEITSAVGVNNPQAQTALAIASVSIRAIALLLKSQQNEPQVVEAMQSMGAAGKARVSLIEKLADAAAIDATFQAAKI